MLTENDIQARVLEKIRTGEVLMRPRAYFLARMVAIAFVATAALLASIFAISFAVFSVHESGEQFLLGFGARGLSTFVSLFPWGAAAVSVFLLVLLEALLRSFSFTYRTPLLRVFLWILLAAILGSTLVNLTPLHSYLLSQADHDSLPVLGALYEQVHDSHVPQGVYRGVVGSVEPPFFTISHSDTDLDSDDGTWTVHVPDGYDAATLLPGDFVYIGGQFIHGIVYAYGVQIRPPGE